MLQQYIIAFTVTALAHLGLALFVYLKGAKKATHRAYTLYACSVAWWSAFEGWAITADDPAFSLILWRICHIGVIGVGVFFVHYAISWEEPAKQVQRRGLLLTGYLVGLVFAILGATPLHFPQAVPKLSLGFFPIAGPIVPAFLVWWVGWATYGVAIFFMVWFRATGLRRTQLSYMCLSWTFAYIGGLPNFLPLFGVQIPYLMPFGTYAIPFSALVATYAIFRHRLMDIHVALTRTTVSMLVYAALLGIPLVWALSWQDILESLLGYRWWAWLWFVCALLAVSAYRLAPYLQQRVQGGLLQEQRRYHQILEHASQGMAQVRELGRLLRLIVHVLTKTVGLSHASIFLAESHGGNFVLRAVRYPSSAPAQECMTQQDPLVRMLQSEREPLVFEELGVRLHNFHREDPFGQRLEALRQQMQTLQAAVIVPSFSQERLIGFLVLGNKRSRKAFSSEDLSVFSTLSNQAALAIENARYLEEIAAHEGRMAQSEKLASLGQLASGVAHEIHNPLTIISGESQVYLERNRGKDLEVDKLLASIIEECNRTSDITRRILRFAKPGRNEFGSVDLRLTVEESLQLAGYQARLEHITRHVEIPANLPKVRGNQNQIQEVLLNLILNACQAMGEAGGTLDISALAQDEMVELRVTDTGPGISSNNLAKIFDPFYTTKHTGTGLGLFVTQRIIAAHKGSLEVKSVEGQGATFIIRLPVDREEAHLIAD
ncbi:MAG: GAF domain-containing protein [Candidatus Omnitrophica bacterium]|nr:GAF domain-containing protein [Candidatus Omnitrophota bacterium]